MHKETNVPARPQIEGGQCPPSDPQSFEAALAELEAIVHQLEEGSLGLAESLARYEQGVSRLKHCYRLLQDAEQKIELLTGVDAEGNAITEPFRDEALSLEQKAGTRRRRKTPSAPPAAGDEEDSPI
jgi:exodeoxyribonuclease VII small subunit